MSNVKFSKWPATIITNWSHQKDNCVCSIELFYIQPLMGRFRQQWKGLTCPLGLGLFFLIANQVGILNATGSGKLFV